MLSGQMGRLDIGIESLPCTRYNSVCQANVILLRRLEPGRYVDFRLSVRNTRGRSARIACSITGTNATTPRDTIFPHQPSIILVPEVSMIWLNLFTVTTRIISYVSLIPLKFILHLHNVFFDISVRDPTPQLSLAYYWSKKNPNLCLAFILYIFKRKLIIIGSAIKQNNYTLAIIIIIS